MCRFVCISIVIRCEKSRTMDDDCCVGGGGDNWHHGDSRIKDLRSDKMKTTRNPSLSCLGRFSSLLFLQKKGLKSKISLRGDAAIIAADRIRTMGLTVGGRGRITMIYGRDKRLSDEKIAAGQKMGIFRRRGAEMWRRVRPGSSIYARQLTDQTLIFFAAIRKGKMPAGTCG